MNMSGNAGSTAVGKAVQSPSTEEVGATMLYSISIFYSIFFFYRSDNKNISFTGIKINRTAVLPVPAPQSCINSPHTDVSGYKERGSIGRTATPTAICYTIIPRLVTVASYRLES